MMSNAWLYEIVQRAAGSRHIRKRLTPHLGALTGQRVLDIGAGTGLYAAAIGSAARYVALDSDADRLQLLALRYPDAETIVGDARRLPLANDTFDAALCIFVAHHLDDLGLGQMLEEASRVSTRLILLDPLKTARVRGRLLWRIDRGAYPRTEGQILRAIRSQFGVVDIERFSVHHEYLLCIADRDLGPPS